MGKGSRETVDDEFSDAPIMATDTPLFLKEKHITYWLRCLRSPLPHQYTSNDSNRMTLAFFTISALDLLGVLYTRTTVTEREEYTRWIYRCQHPGGGFRGFPGTDFGAKATAENAVWDPANVPATYFALAALVILGDDLTRVDRKACLTWLRTVQRPDGSFGEGLGADDRVEGGMDTRFGYCAMVIRWILRGNVPGEVEGVPDVKTDEMVSCIHRSQTYDGGISEIPFHEAHAGFTYCAIGALALLDRLPLPNGTKGAQKSSHEDPAADIDMTPAPGLSSFDVTVQWLVNRLTTSIDEEDLDDAQQDSEDDRDDTSMASTTTSDIANNRRHSTPPSEIASTGAISSGTTPEKTCEKDASFQKIRSMPASALSDRNEPSEVAAHPDVSLFDPIHSQWVGCNGRANKLADTCYIFWVCGSLSVLNTIHLINPTPVRRYLCEKTQHLIAGGFGKLPGDPPDMYHAYLGLAALAVLDVGYAGEEGVLARDTSSSSSSVHDSSDEEDEQDFTHREKPSLAHQRVARGDPTRARGLTSPADEGRVVRRSRLGDIKIQNVQEDWAHTEGAGEGGEVGDGGGVLRRLDPALCFSVRAREWLESLSWRRATVGNEMPKREAWNPPTYPRKAQDWQWAE